MSRRKTSSNVASKASKVLTSPRSSGVQRVLAGSALSQAGKGVSSAKVAAVAAKALRSPRSSATTKTLAASIVSQGSGKSK